MNIGIEGLFALVLAVLAVSGLGWFAWKRFYETTPLDPVHSGKKHSHSCKYDQEEQRRTAHNVTPRIDLSDLPPADPKVAALLQTVSTSVIEAALRDLSGEQSFLLAGKTQQITSRNSYYKDIELALQYLEAFYAKLGVKTERHAYKIRGRTYYNLVVEFPGKVEPSKILVLGGHLDSTAGWPWSTENTAPGADDDCSGTVGLMEIAKMLLKVDCDYTVRIVHFTCEEQGLYGSYAYSDKCAKEGADIVAMLEMDMIGYCAKPGNRVDIHDDADKNGSHRLVELMVRGVKRYSLNLNPVDTHNHAVENRSDHAGFLDHGWQAVLVSDEFTDDGFNPNYHSTTDRVSTLNLPYMAEVIKMVAISAFELAKAKVR